MAIETGQTYRSTLEVRQADGTLVTPSTSTYTVTLPTRPPPPDPSPSPP